MLHCNNGPNYMSKAAVYIVTKEKGKDNKNNYPCSGKEIQWVNVTAGL